MAHIHWIFIKERNCVLVTLKIPKDTLSPITKGKKKIKKSSIIINIMMIFYIYWTHFFGLIYMKLILTLLNIIPRIQDFYIVTMFREIVSIVDEV